MSHGIRHSGRDGLAHASPGGSNRDMTAAGLPGSSASSSSSLAHLVSLTRRRRCPDRVAIMNGTGARAGLTEFPLLEVESKPAGSRFSIDERRARGKAARAESHGLRTERGSPPSVRRDPVELLEEQARTRLPELVPIRYGRMLVSPFTFFRGAAYIMAADLANGARTGIYTQLCGDAHLSNFRVLRRAGPSAGVQHQRFRRDVAGAVRVGCEAAGGELHRGRSGSRLRRGNAAFGRLDDCARISRRDGDASR